MPINALKYQYIVASQNLETDHIYRVMRCHSGMNENEYTIITIPGLCASNEDATCNIDELDQDILLFSLDWYKNKNIQQKALLFLLTFVKQIIKNMTIIFSKKTLFKYERQTRGNKYGSWCPR